jgi:uncharacterized protein (TIGR03083 family)
VVAPAAEAVAEPVVELLREEWEAISDLGRVLEEREWDMPSECPGWTVRDVMSHMIGTERSLLGDTAPHAPDAMPDHVHNDIGARNEAWVSARRSVPGPTVLEEFRAVTARRFEALRSLSSAGFDEVGPSPLGPVPYREFMRVRVMDCWVHEQDIRVATGRPGHQTGPAAELALDRIASAMPFVVGKQAGAPDGASVRFEVRGARPRRIDISVRDGRAVVVDALDGEPSATLDMEVDAFWRLACGRVNATAARAAGLVELRGDDDLASAVAAAMRFMI